MSSHWTYIGKGYGINRGNSQEATNDGLNIDIAGVFVVDETLSTNAISAVNESWLAWYLVFYVLWICLWRIQLKIWMLHS